uniref:Uncharacterized protein n=1 Tax=Plectus sambesii TaxID=2011161 RepID=A0A914X0C6_9BILA
MTASIALIGGGGGGTGRLVPGVARSSDRPSVSPLRSSAHRPAPISGSRCSPARQPRRRWRKSLPTIRRGPTTGDWTSRRALNNPLLIPISVVRRRLPHVLDRLRAMLPPPSLIGHTPPAIASVIALSRNSQTIPRFRKE